VYPLSSKGRLFASFIIIVGIGTFIYTFTRIGQMIFEGEILNIFGRRKMKRELAKLKNHYIVCGYGRIGSIVAEGLEREGVPFCVVDKDPNLEKILEDKGYLYLIGDATDESVLREAGIERAKGVLGLLATDAANLYLTITAKGLNPDVTVLARALDEKAEMNLIKGGADKVVSPYKIAGLRILQAAVKPAVVEFLELVTHREYLSLSLEEILVTPESPLSGVSLKEADVRKRFKVIVVAIKKMTGEMGFNPEPEEIINPGDTLLVLGKDEDLRNLKEKAR